MNLKCFKMDLKKKLTHIYEWNGFLNGAFIIAGAR